jgi:hypothetical protein
MEFEQCIIKIQKYMTKPPLIILGSGASAPYKLPLMDDLKKLITSNKLLKSHNYTKLKNNLETMNLELAMDKTNLSEEQNIQIRKIVWEYVNMKDFDFFSKLITERIEFPLAKLIKIVLQTTPNIATIITTNYDRLAEYAADLIEATIVTGFEGNVIRQMKIPSNSVINKRIKVRERVVNIWKVHGSLDWFENISDETSKVISYPMTKKLPLNHNPLIIPPGKDKYSFTHREPFRDIITQADSAFSNAESFICIGYGFNDDHIQQKLINQIKSNKPIVVLCHKATEACQRNVISPDVKCYFVVERSGKNNIQVTSNESNGVPIEYENNDLCNLPTFLNKIWG